MPILQVDNEEVTVEDKAKLNSTIVNNMNNTGELENYSKENELNVDIHMGLSSQVVLNFESII